MVHDSTFPVVLGHVVCVERHTWKNLDVLRWKYRKVKRLAVNRNQTKDTWLVQPVVWHWATTGRQLPAITILYMYCAGNASVTHLRRNRVAAPFPSSPSPPPSPNLAFSSLSPFPAFPYAIFSPHLPPLSLVFSYSPLLNFSLFFSPFPFPPSPWFLSLY